MTDSAYVALGSNLGRRVLHLVRALEALAHTPGTRLLEVSEFYESPPFGPSSNWYVNAVARLETTLPPRSLLARLLDLEQRLGRDRSWPWPDRTLDLDLLLWEDLVLSEPGLVLPHPRMHLRRFVLQPLCDLSENLVHPVLGATARELLAAVSHQPLRPIRRPVLNPA